jgi:hypothetical protein
MSVSDLRSSLRYRFIRKLRSDAEPVDPELLWPEHVRRRPYEAYGTCAKFAMCTEPEAIISGPNETGKTLCALNLLNDTAWSNPGMQGLIVRKVQHTMAGSVLQTFTRKVLPSGSPVTVFGGNNPERFIYPNGSTIWVGGMDDPAKILSSERDLIYVNQAEELALDDWEALTTRVTGRAGTLKNPRLMGDCNPGAPTHWIRSRAVAKVLRLFDSTHRDNPMLYDRKGHLTAQGKRTLERLDRLTGARKLRWRHGIWAVPEGAIYDVFDDARHKVRAFKVPDLWPRVVGIDPIGVKIGALWVAYDPVQERLNVYREYIEPFGETTPGHAGNLLRLSRNEQVWAWVCGAPSERQARVDWKAAGIPVVPPTEEGQDSSVWGGIDRVYELLANVQLVVHDSCPGLLSEIGSYQRKMKGAEATEQIQDKERYHLLDCLRYIVVWLTQPTHILKIGHVPVNAGDQW